jgi:hypothetical protein
VVSSSKPLEEFGGFGFKIIGGRFGGLGLRIGEWQIGGHVVASRSFRWIDAEKLGRIYP